MGGNNLISHTHIARQVRVSDVHVRTTIGENGVLATVVMAADALEEAERTGQDPAVLFPRRQCHAYHVYDDDDTKPEDVFRASLAPAPFVNEVLFATSMVHYIERFRALVLDPNFLSVPPSTPTASRVNDEHARRRLEFEKITRALTRLTLECIHVPRLSVALNLDPLAVDGAPHEAHQQLFLNQGVTLGSRTLGWVSIVF